MLAHCAGLQTELDGGTYVPPPEDWQPPAQGSTIDRVTSAQVAARKSWGPEEIRTELRAAREGHVARVQRVDDWSSGVEGPTGRTTEQELLGQRCYDLWTHIQDLHVALDRPIDVGDDSAAARLAHEWVQARLPWLLAKRVTEGRDAALRIIVAAPAPLDAVVSVADGRGSFDGTQDVVDSTVRTAPEALTLLVSGRDEAQDWRARGLLDWVGPVAEAFVQRARFF